MVKQRETHFKESKNLKKYPDAYFIQLGNPGYHTKYLPAGEIQGKDNVWVYQHYFRLILFQYPWFKYEESHNLLYLI